MEIRHSGAGRFEISEYLYKRNLMNYKVIPFNADIVKGDGTKKAAGQLETLINQHANDGWVYRGLETLQTGITTPAVPAIPGTNGCAGIGATPGRPGVQARTDFVQVHVAVFERSE
jgi:hypothetical protein